MKNHSQTPWTLDDTNRIFSKNGTVLAKTLNISNKKYEYAWANQELIVRAVNSHYELLEACKEALTIVDLTSSAVFGNSETFKALIKRLKEAIAKAEAK